MRTTGLMQQAARVNELDQRSVDLSCVQTGRSESESESEIQKINLALARVKNTPDGEEIAVHTRKFYSASRVFYSVC